MASVLTEQGVRPRLAAGKAIFLSVNDKSGVLGGVFQKRLLEKGIEAHPLEVKQDSLSSTGVEMREFPATIKPPCV